MSTPGLQRFASPLLPVFVAVLAFGTVGGAAASPPANWTTLHASHSAVSVAVPETWQVRVPGDKQTRLLVVDRTEAAWLGVVIGPNDESWGAFYTRMYKLRRTEELARDPHASIRTRVVSLPAGRAFESIVVRTDPRFGKLREVQLDFLQNGSQYEFEYFCLEKLSGSYVPVFDVSARSIRLAQ